MKRMILSLIGFLVVLYMAMFVSTNSVVEDVKNIMYGQVKKSFTVNTPLHVYNRKDDFETTTVNVNVTRKFVIHNFFDGYMWVNYTCEGFDKEGKRTYGSWRIPSRWKIHRKNGKWQVVEITEAP